MKLCKRKVKDIREKIEIAEEVEHRTEKREVFNELISKAMLSAGIITVVIIRCF